METVPILTLFPRADRVTNDAGIEGVDHGAPVRLARRLGVSPGRVRHALYRGVLPSTYARWKAKLDETAKDPA
jgi:hypothetical protein